MTTPESIGAILTASIPQVVENETDGIMLRGQAEGSGIGAEQLIGISHADPFGNFGRESPEMFTGRGFSTPCCLHRCSPLIAQHGGMVLTKGFGAIGGIVVKDHDTAPLAVMLNDFGQVARKFIAAEDGKAERG